MHYNLLRRLLHKNDVHHERTVNLLRIDVRGQAMRVNSNTAPSEKTNEKKIVTTDES